VATSAALLIFRSPFVKEFQLLRQGSYGDGQRMTYLLLGLHVWPLVRAHWGEVWF